MNRRPFLCGLTLGPLTTVLATAAQQPPGKTARIGYVSLASGPRISWRPFSKGCVTSVTSRAATS